MLICLGGVCIPYTAVVPLFILGLKWIVTKLGLARFFPKFVQDILQLESIPSNKDCCSQALSVPSSDGVSLVKVLETDEEFEELLKDEAQKVVCKFTSTWCQPCKKIQPFFDRLSTQYKEGVAFRTIDVDDFDEIASKYNVAMMPTFLVLQGEKVIGTYSGSKENELQSFLEEHAGSKKGN
jgi:thioredoxin 1